MLFCEVGDDWEEPRAVAVRIEVGVHRGISGYSDVHEAHIIRGRSPPAGLRRMGEMWIPDRHDCLHPVGVSRVPGRRRPSTGDVFTMTKSSPLTYTNWRQRIWTQAVELADVGHTVPHDLRHTGITRLFTVVRWTPSEVQRFVGHSDPRITLGIYAHVTPESMPRPSQFGTGIGRD